MVEEFVYNFEKKGWVCLGMVDSPLLRNLLLLRFLSLKTYQTGTTSLFFFTFDTKIVLFNFIQPKWILPIPSAT